jgi:ribosomal protein S18 acetylase RimI-like enzyme
MSAVRPARSSDISAVGAVHVSAWRSAYAGLLPGHALVTLSVERQVAYYTHLLRAGHIIEVAAPEGPVVGFATASARPQQPLAEGEIETLYVLDDHREQGLGRALMRAAAIRLQAAGCHSAFLWVLSENPSRWFYERMGGQRIAEGEVGVAGTLLAQTAFLWDPIECLIDDYK